MSFADELRKEPERQRNEAIKQEEKQWEKLIEILIDDIKEGCRYFAGQGETSWSFRAEQIIKNCFEEPYVYIDRRYDEDRWIEEISFDDTQEGLLYIFLESLWAVGVLPRRNGRK